MPEHLFTLFQGSPLDVYIHTMIFALGIGILASGAAVLFSCRNIASYFHLIGLKNGLRTRIYRTFYKYHSLYWFIFWFILVLHLFMTILHLGLPVIGEPYFLAQEVTLFTAIGNLIFLFLILTSCRTFAFFISRNPLANKAYKSFYKYHSYLWLFLAISLPGHIIFGMIHSMNT